MAAWHGAPLAALNHELTINIHPGRIGSDRQVTEHDHHSDSPKPPLHPWLGLLAYLAGAWALVRRRTGLGRAMGPDSPQPYLGGLHLSPGKGVAPDRLGLGPGRVLSLCRPYHAAAHQPLRHARSTPTRCARGSDGGGGERPGPHCARARETSSDLTEMCILCKHNNQSAMNDYTKSCNRKIQNEAEQAYE